MLYKVVILKLTFFCTNVLFNALNGEVDAIRSLNESLLKREPLEVCLHSL